MAFLSLYLLLNDGLSMLPFYFVFFFKLGNDFCILICEFSYHLFSLFALDQSLLYEILFFLDPTISDFLLLLFTLLLSFLSPPLLSLLSLLNSFLSLLLLNFSANEELRVNSLFLLLVHEHFQMVFVVVVLHFLHFRYLLYAHVHFTLVALFLVFQRR